MLGEDERVVVEHSPVSVECFPVAELRSGSGFARSFEVLDMPLPHRQIRERRCDHRKDGFLLMVGMRCKAREHGGCDDVALLLQQCLRPRLQPGLLRPAMEGS